MSREEAIKYLKGMKDECNDTIHKVRYVTQEEALEMAIKALEQEPSGDLISRQAVIDACEQSINILEAVDRIMDLPSVEQEPKTGHWIKTISENGITSAVRCSKCGFEDNRYMLFRYCPNCGARMESEDKE